MERKKIKTDKFRKKRYPFLLPKSVHNSKTIEGHNGAIYDVIYYNNTIFTSSADKFVAQWDLIAGKQLDFAVKLEKSAYNIAFSQDHNILAIGNNSGGIHVVDIEKRKEVRLIEHHRDSIFSLVYSPKKNLFYSADRLGLFCVWKGENFDLLLSLPFECDKIREINLSEDEEYLALACQDGYIRILETSHFNMVNEIKTMHTDSVNCTIFNGDVLYSGGKDAYIRKWNWQTGEQLLNIPGHNYAVYDIQLLQNNEILVSVSFDKSIKLWNAENLSLIERIEFKNTGHRHTVNRIAKISEDCFVTVGDDRKIKVWEFIQHN